MMKTTTPSPPKARTACLVLFALIACAGGAVAGDYAPPLVTTAGVSGPLLAAERNGRTLYVRHDANGGAGRCDEECARQWPAYEVLPVDFPTDGLGIVHRADGTRQWAMDGRALHFFAADRRRGEALGEGVDGWRAVRPNGTERAMRGAVHPDPIASHE